MSLIDHIDELYARRLLVELDEQSEVVAGPIIGPDTAIGTQQLGTIRMVASDCPIHLKIDQRVVISKYAGMDMNLEGQSGDERVTYKLCSPQDVIMRVSEEPTIAPD